MSQHPAPPATISDCEVMASVDNSDEGEQLIIAELCREDAYVSMSTEATVVIDDWR